MCSPAWAGSTLPSSLPARTSSPGGLGFVEALCGPLQDGLVGPLRCGGHHLNVVRDDPGHDAAERRAHDFDLHRNCGYRRRQERPDRFAVCPRCRLCSSVVRIFSFRGAGTGSFDTGSIARPKHGFGEPAFVRRNFYFCRHLSILRTQARVPYAVPAAVSIFLHELGDDARRQYSGLGSSRVSIVLVAAGR